jgi:hypothetical protein
MLATDLTGQDFTAVLIGDVSGNWTSAAAPAPPMIQSGTVAVGLVHNATNVADPNTAWLLVAAIQPAIYGVDLTLAFDSSLVLEQVRSGSLGQNHALAFHSPTPGSARISASSAVPVTGEGVLLELQFSGPPVDLAVTSIRVDESQVATVTDPGLDIFDSDHDGVINILETEVYHSDPTVADSDLDGQTDGQEVIAGTSPTDPGSFFSIQSLIAGAEGQIKIAWHSVPGRNYCLQSSETLEESGWTDVLPAITADEVITSVTVTPPAATTQLFYRVVVLSSY